MNPPISLCNEQLLKRSLDDTLSEFQEEQLAQHLSECTACQHKLEQIAAEADAWSRVSDALKQTASYSSLGDDSASGSEDSGLIDVSEHVPTPADFAVLYLEPSTTPDTLGRVGEIEVHAVIGSGGMGVVLKGVQPELRRLVAVKVLAPHLATNGAARKRFAREAQAAAAILHPNVMPILSVSSSGRLPYLVMPYLGCESLQDRLDREGPLELDEILRIGTQAAAGLTAAHAQGLVHRDVKPANILLEKGVDRVMLTDFGLARTVDDASLTRSGVIAGTPQYMSPEQARGDAVDVRSDLFSLGSVLYALCTGRPPFRAETSFGILRRVTDTQPRPIREVNAQIPAWLEGIVFKLLAKETAKRFASAEELAKLLEQCLAHVQQPTAVPLPQRVAELGATPSRVPKIHRIFTGTRRRRRTALLAGGLLAGTLLAAAVWNRDAREDSANTPIPVAELEASESDPPLTEDSLSPSMLDWDSTETAIRDLHSDSDELERQIDQVWDVPFDALHSLDGDQDYPADSHPTPFANSRQEQ